MKLAAGARHDRMRRAALRVYELEDLPPDKPGIHALINHNTIATQHDAEPPIAKSPAFVSKFLKACE